MVNVVGSTDNFARWKPASMQDHLTLTELARHVDRDKTRILQCERDHKEFPKPARVKVGRLRVRLYSPDEVSMIEEWFRNARPGRPRAEEGRQ